MATSDESDADPFEQDQLKGLYGPEPLPGNGAGFLDRNARDVILAQTGCAAATRKRVHWDEWKLTIHGPPENLKKAKALAHAFILASQARFEESQDTPGSAHDPCVTKTDPASKTSKKTEARRRKKDNLRAREEAEWAKTKAEIQQKAAAEHMAMLQRQQWAMMQAWTSQMVMNTFRPPSAGSSTDGAQGCAIPPVLPGVFPPAPPGLSGIGYVVPPVNKQQEAPIKKEKGAPIKLEKGIPIKQEREIPIKLEKDALAPASKKAPKNWKRVAPGDDDILTEEPAHVPLINLESSDEEDLDNTSVTRYIIALETFFSENNEKTPWMFS